MYNLDLPPKLFECLLLLWETITPSQSEIFFVIVAWSYVLAFQDHNTLPKWNIFCYCSFILCIGFSGPNTLPKWNIFCYCSLIVCIGLWGPNTLPKWNIFWTHTKSLPVCSSSLPALSQLAPSLLRGIL